MIRRDDGRPWFIQGVAIDITELKQAEQALQEERNVVATILDTVGALVAVLDPQGRIVRFNRACERASGHRVESARGRYWSEFFDAPDEAVRFRRVLAQWVDGTGPVDLEGVWVGESGDRHVIAWSGTVLRSAQGHVEYIIATGNDVTERKRLERAVLEVSAREQRRIGQDLHDGLGQHLTGTAFMSKVLQQRLTEQRRPEAIDAEKIVTLVNEAIEKTRELSRGLVPVVSDAAGLMGALGRFAGEVEDLFGVPCRFECDTPVLIDDVAAATHLFHIAQDAVTNAIKHGAASELCIRLAACGGTGRLIVEDDGVGIDPGRDRGTGMGLHIMRYRANMVGGSMKMTFAPDRPRGTAVECVFPLRARD
jgi:two-component system CheB/CheR fusion protein